MSFLPSGLNASAVTGRTGCRHVVDALEPVKHLHDLVGRDLDQPDFCLVANDARRLVSAMKDREANAGCDRLAVRGVRQRGDQPLFPKILRRFESAGPDVDPFLVADRDGLAVAAESGSTRAVFEVRSKRILPLTGFDVPSGGTDLAGIDENSDRDDLLAVRRPEDLLAGRPGESRAARFVLVVKPYRLEAGCGVEDAGVEPEVRGILLAVW